MKLYFKHSNGDREYLCDAQGIEDGIHKALNDLKIRAPHFTSYYQRFWEDNNMWWIDVGDWSCFYVLKPDEDEEDGKEEGSHEATDD